jgi:formamidopyrimidine-DNA glycosylase
MPELPEVETVRLGLIPHFEGRIIERVLVRRHDLRQPIPKTLAKSLAGRRLIRIARRAKYLLLHVEGGLVLILHLGMSGRILIGHGAPPEGKHDHLVLIAQGGATAAFNDPRRFGLALLAPEEGLETHPLFAGLGPEPLSQEFDGNVLRHGLEGRRGPLKPALMDQRLVVGVGNIYASEALFRARLSPLRPAGSLSAAEARRLANAIKGVLEEAIASGGSSLRDHKRPDGELGYFQHHFAVYGRTGQPCPGCDCQEGVRRIVQAGRSTFYCAVRQA